MSFVLAAALLLAAPSSFPVDAASIQPPRRAAPAATPVATPVATPATGSRPLTAATVSRLRDDDRPVIDIELPTLAASASVRVTFTPVTITAPSSAFVVATLTPEGVVERPIATDVRLLSGTVEGHPDARAFVAIADDFVGGFISLGADADGRTIWLSSGPHGRGLPPVAFDPLLADPRFVAPATDFCKSDELAQPDVVAGGGGGVAGLPPCREVLLAIDTDVEYTANLFAGNQGLALAYALALTAATSEIYTEDLNVRLRVQYIRLWEGTDPWNQTSTVNQLYEYRDYWVANEGSVVRDLGHFLSGRGLGGGVAWLPGLCGNEYAFGLSANLGGSFPYPLVDNSGANWDLMVFAHELGHNFGSPHTHSYDPPLDGCGLGDCSLAATGTIMSYCHTCPGGLGNIALNFHPGNVETMLAFLDGATCVVSSDTSGAFAADDYVTGLAGTNLTVSPLANDERMNCEELSLDSVPATTSNGAAISLVPGDPPTLVVQIPGNATTDDSFSYSIVDTNGDTDSATVVIDVLPLLAPTTVVNTVPGADASHYEIPESSVLPDFAALSPYLVTSVTAVNFPSTGGEFANSGRVDLVASVFEGWVTVPTSGLWTFFSESDDGSRLFIDGVLVVNNDGLHGMLEKSGSLGLQAGTHAIRVEFFENFGGAGEIVRWSGPGVAKATIPAAAWSRGGSVVVPADLTGDGAVDGADLAVLLGAWGSAGPGDLTGDGTVDGSDLAILLGAWG